MSEERKPTEKKQSEKKKASSELDRTKIVIRDGEYGMERGEEFLALTNFILQCEGLVEEDGEVVGFMVCAKPKQHRNTSAREWLDSVFLTRRDMSDTYSIVNKLGSSLLWISSTKDFLPAYLKHMCDDYEKDVGRKLIPVKIFGLQPKSNPPVWVFSKTMQVKLERGEIIRLTKDESPYTVLPTSSSAYCYDGELDSGETLKEMIMTMETFFGADIAAVLLVLGGTGMSFHYRLLNNIMGGVPPTLAVGDPVSGKSAAVEAALSLFDQRECIGAGSEAKLLDSLNNRTVPMWWDDIDSLVILEKMTVLLYNKAKKVTMGKDTSANTLPVISINYTKLVKGFKKLQTTSEDFGRIFTRMLPIPFQKREGKQRISERLEGRKRFEALLQSAPKSLGVIIRLHEAYENMTDSPLFKVIEEEIQALELDVRTQSNFAVLLYSTGKILEYVDLYEIYWTDVILFMKEIMVKHYKVLLDGDIPTSQSSDISSTKVPSSFDDQEEFFLEVLKKIFERASEYPDEDSRSSNSVHDSIPIEDDKAVSNNLSESGASNMQEEQDPIAGNSLANSGGRPEEKDEKDLGENYFIQEDKEKWDFDNEILQRAAEAEESRTSGGETTTEKKGPPSKKQKKGGKDKVTNLIDGIHPGIIKGKRTRTAKKPK